MPASLRAKKLIDQISTLVNEITFTVMSVVTNLSACRTRPALVFKTILFLLISFPVLAQTFPEGFTTVQIATGIIKPSAMTFTPDGRIFVTEQGGAVRVIKNGTLLTTPLIKLRVSLRGEGGLVGITVDPNFATNQYLYLYYTLPDGSRNRISRFKCSGDVASLSSETVILSLDTLTATIHNGGAMHFKNGLLYASIGDNSNEANAQDLNTYHGKLIRINPDGSVPAGNPFTSGSEQKKRIWSYGLRNPFTFDIQPGSGKIFVNDVGLDKWEEINDATTSGKNFGWPEAEGASTNPAFTNPVYAYAHGRSDEFGCAITGGAFYNPPQPKYPAEYTGLYFFQDYCGQWIKTLSVSSSSTTVQPFAEGIGDDALALMVGSDGNLHYLVRSTGSVYKVIYTTAGAPAIVKHPSSMTVSERQPATFSVTATGQSPLAYQWLKNGVNISGATGASYTIAQTSTGDAGGYRVKVSNALGSVLSNTATLTVTAFNNNPVAAITTPAAGALYRAGDVISFSGSATDTEDGDLPASAFTWWVDFHHDVHRHDGPPVASGVKAGSFAIPTRGETSDNVWYRLYLIVEDSRAAKDTVYRDIYPHKSTLSFVTQPAGLKIKLEGQILTTPLSVVSVERLERTISAVSPQTFNGKTYVFDRWLHGGMETQTLPTPESNVTYTAVYKESATSAPIQHEMWTNVIGREVSTIPVNSPPSVTRDLQIFEAPANLGDQYGSRIRGYVHAPVTGNYVFWIASDDRSELWLSSGEDPAKKIKIASVSGYTSVRQWTKYTTQQSSPVSLVAGGKYYIEALHKEYLGGDHVAVGWQLPGGTLERPIPGNRLSPFGLAENTPPVVSISTPAPGQSFTNSGTIQIAANASDPDGTISKVEFFDGTNRLGEDATSPYTFSWSGAAPGQHLVVAKAHDNNSATSSASVGIYVTGKIQREVWDGIVGREVSLIPLNSPPSSTSDLMIFESPLNTGNDYGCRIRGYVIPSVSGNYVFWIASDDRSELWLSTNDDPSAKLKIASVSGYTSARQWNKYLTQQSGTMSLTAGKRYYIEALHKENTGADHLAVGWQLPNGVFERPIPGNRLLPFEGMLSAEPGTTASSAFQPEQILSSTETNFRDVSLFPNPTRSGRIEISFGQTEQLAGVHSLSVQVTSVTGKVVHTETLSCDGNCNSFIIDAGDTLQPGVYVVTINAGQNRFSRKLFVH
jgi:glucose/arabinose dehydrogenase